MIVIAAAKTLKEVSNSSKTIHVDCHSIEKVNFLVEKMKDFSKEELGEVLKIKNKTLDNTYNYYQKFETNISAPAILKYDGVVFKQLVDIENKLLNKDSQDYIFTNVYIISTMYGIINGMSNIKNYRLDFTNSSILRASLGCNLYDFWRRDIQKEIMRIEPIHILNLASKEYFKVIKFEDSTKLKVYNIECKNKIPSYQIKKIRGEILNYCIENKIKDYSKLIDSELETIKFVGLENNTLIFEVLESR